MEHKTLIALLLGATMAAGCGENTASTNNNAAVSSASAQDIGDVIANVNGLEVGSKAFKAAAARKVPADGKALNSDERKDVLKRLVDEKLLYQAALKEGLDRDPKVQKVMVNTLLREAVYAKVKNSDFTDESLQKYFDEHQSEFVVPEKVQIKRVLIKVSDDRDDAAAKAESERLLAEVKADSSKFADVAKNSSEGPYKRRGGDVGFVPADGKPGLDEAIVTEAFKLSVGGVSDVFKTDEGYNFVMVANKRDKVERTFQQMKGSVLRKVKNEKLKSLYDNYVADLRTGAKITTEDAKVDAIEVEAAKAPKHPGMRPPMPTSGQTAPRSAMPPGLIKSK
jgi:parvulin-like peptidyl-prolyl isomerase